MTPEELERLQSCTAEIAKILYNNTPPSELTSLENIEKHLRQQWLEKVAPQIVVKERSKSIVSPMLNMKERWIHND